MRMVPVVERRDCFLEGNKMQAYEGYFEDGRFYIAGETTHIKIKGRRRAFITILDEPMKKNTASEPNPVKKPRSELRGIFKGKIRMSDDFDAPLEEMKEYME